MGNWNYKSILSEFSILKQSFNDNEMSVYGSTFDVCVSDVTDFPISQWYQLSNWEIYGTLTT